MHPSSLFRTPSPIHEAELQPRGNVRGKSPTFDTRRKHHSINMHHQTRSLKIIKNSRFLSVTKKFPKQSPKVIISLNGRIRPFIKVSRITLSCGQWRRGNQHAYS